MLPLIIAAFLAWTVYSSMPYSKSRLFYTLAAFVAALILVPMALDAVAFAFTPADEVEPQA